MKKRILNYMQLTLQGIGIASLGTLNIFEPKLETIILGCGCIILGLITSMVNKEKQQ